MRPLALIAAALLAAPAFAGPIIDPAGDTVGVPVPGLDIVNSPGFTNVPGGYQLTVNFAGPISAPSAFAPNSVAGFVDLDLDLNPLTGAAPFTSTLVPGPLNLGSEAFINLFDELSNPGFVGLYDANTFSLLGFLPISFAGNSFTLTLPGALIGNAPAFTFALVSVPLSGDGLDRAPNGATPFVVPEPSSLAVVAGLLACGAIWRANRRRASAGESGGSQPVAG